MTSRRTFAPLAGVAARSQPEDRLVALSREGRERAFDEIVRRYRRPLVAYAGAVVPRDRAEDVVQDALVKAHAAMRGSDAEIHLGPWLYTIVRNTALNDLRDNPQLERVDEDYDGVLQPPELAERREQLAELVRSLRGLPEQQREALIGRELEGRSHEEIAAGMATSPGAVRGLIFRARAALRDTAGMLIPLPVARFLLSSGDGAAAGATGAGAGGAALGATLGGGGGAGAKVGVAAVVAALAVGSGVAVHERHGSNGDSGSAQARETRPDSASHRGSTADSSGGGRGSSEFQPGEGHGGNSGPGGGGSSGSEGGGDGQSGPGGADDGGGSGSGSSGSGSSGSGSSGSGSSGEGSGGGELEVETGDDGAILDDSSNSGPGGGGSGSDEPEIDGSGGSSGPG